MPNFLKSFFHKSMSRRFYLRHPYLRKLRVGERKHIHLCSYVSDYTLNTNIANYVTQFDEMLWGYRGTGPFVLACNILFTYGENNFFCTQHGWEFMEDFLVNRDTNDSWVIPSERIIEWIENKKNGATHVE